MDTACLIAAMVSYSASPVYRSARVRPCTASAWMPACSAIFATFRPFLLARSQPVRIFSVTGTSTAPTTACRISLTKASSLNKAEPAALLQTFFAGQPMLISMIWAPAATLACAAAAIICASPPAIWTERGSGSPSWMRRRLDLRLFHRDRSLETISDTTMPAPMRWQSVRNGWSVTPAMGARIRLLRSV